jgi:DNA-binding winged helix-turn-helix (wHTH) protein/Tfp pilus assembly protein PilF
MAILDVSEAPADASLLFSGFELRLDSGELRLRGVPVKLQLQPARVLALLALRAGAVVTREEIRNAVWGEESHIDFDLALNYCIRQIRVALEDSAAQPRFVETLPRVGYRFIGPVEVRRDSDPPPAAVPEPEPQDEPATVRATKTIRRRILAGALALASLVILIALRSQMARGVKPKPSARSTALAVSREAMRAYLEGQYFDAHDEPAKARDAFQKATSLAPSYAPAWAGLAHALLEDHRPLREVGPILEAAERRSLQLDPKLALAHLNRAMRLFQYEYDWRESERELRRALELDPHLAAVHYEYAILLSAQGRHAEALAQVEQALYLQPERLVGRYAWFYYLARRYDEAIEKARRQIELAPGKTSETNPTQHDLFWAFRTLTLASLAKGDRDSALVAAVAEANWLGAPRPASLKGFWSEKESRFAKTGPARPSFAVVPAIELGKPERALDLLFQICQERSDPMIAFLRVDPLYDSLRNQPRFKELLRCANLADEPTALPQS